MEHVKPPRLDIDPNIALAHAEYWVRRGRVERKPFSHDVMKQARVQRSVYQRKLLRRFLRFVISAVRPFRATDISPRVSPTQAPRG